MRDRYSLFAHEGLSYYALAASPILRTTFADQAPATTANIARAGMAAASAADQVVVEDSFASDNARSEKVRLMMHFTVYNVYCP